MQKLDLLKDQEAPKKKEEPKQAEKKEAPKKKPEPKKVDPKQAEVQEQPKKKTVKKPAPKKVQEKPAAPVEEYFEAPKKKHKGWKVTGVLFLMLLIIAVGAYAGVSYYYFDKFIPGTIINSVDCSGKTASEVEKLIASKVENYQVEIQSRDLPPEVITGEEIQYQYISNGDIVKLLKAQKPYLWAYGYYKNFVYSAGENITFDKDLLKEKVNALACMAPQNQVMPVDAYISFENDDFLIVPENEGRQIVTSKAQKMITLGVANSESVIDMNAVGAYRRPTVFQDNEKLHSLMEEYRKYCRASITYEFGDLTEVVDGMVIKDWLTTNPDGSLTKDASAFHDHIVEYVAHLAKGYDTIGMGRSFTASDGRTVTVFGEDYGWEIDQQAEIEQLEREVNSGAVVSREPHYLRTANSHDDSDVGNTYIEVDLGLQHMYYYKEGNLVYESDIISGAPDGRHDTPPGIYKIFNKESPAVLIGDTINGKPEYVSPVSYWMAFNGGIGFHDATWQYWGFGGDLYRTYGSHGCINLPLEKAAELYEITNYDDPVVCFY